MKYKISFHERYRNPILFLGIVLFTAGILCYTKMQTNLFPEVLFPRITVIADAGEQPIERIMATTTKPLESAVKKVQGVSVVKSSTSRGSCTIDVYFDWGTDIYAAKSQLESRVNEIKGFLPSGIVISTEAMNQSLYPVYGYTLESDTHSRIELRDAANLIARPAFSQIKGISNVVVRGGRTKEYVIEPDAAKMSQLGITPTMIKKAFDETNFVSGNGNIAAYHRIYLTITDTRINTIDDLRNTIIRNTNNRVIHLSDIARVDVKERQDFFKINAKGKDAVLIDLVKQQGVNLLDFAKNTEDKAKEIRNQLPPGYTLQPYYNQSAFVSNSVHSVMETIIEGLFLAIIVMIFFLRSWRSSLVVMLTIPVTIAFSFLLMYMAGITINVMSLGALAASVGLIIDDAIVIIEQIYRDHEEHPEYTKYDAVKKSINYLFPAMVASSLATIVIYFPFRLMSGLAGSFFRELSNTMQLTLVASFLVTWLLLPVLHLFIGYKKKKDSPRTDISSEDIALKKVSWLTQLYKRPYIALAFLITLVGVTIFVSTQLKTGFLPELDEGTIVLDYHTPSGTDIEETDRLCRQMEHIIMSNPDVQTYSRRTALGMSFTTLTSNYGDYLIELKNNRKKTTPEVISELRREISERVPAVTADFGQRISDLLGDLMSTPKPIEVKIFGNDYRVIRQIAQQAENIMHTVPGIVDIDNGMIPAGSSLIVSPNKELLSQYGVSLTDFEQQLSMYVDGVPLCQPADMIEPDLAQASMTGGLQIGSIQDGEQMRRILLRFISYKNNSPEKLKQQPIFLPDGTTRPISFFADIKVQAGEIEQRREDLKSDVALTARLDGRDLGGTVSELQSQFKKHLSMPKGYNVTFGGAYSEQQQSFNELMTILCTAILLVLTVLMFLFRQWKISFAILFISICGICGSLIALWITGVPLNVSSYTGIIMIVGIIAENSIFTVQQYRMNRKHGAGVVESVNYAIALRIRPKLMTAIGAILALLPLALGLGMGAQMQQPLAVAVIGGFIAGLPMLLIVLPSLMMIIYRNRDKK